MRRAFRTVALLVWAVLIPTVASAQFELVIAGVARDSSGGVLPGVTIEVASPALIEKVRAAVSDGTGQYRIIDLRPGTYTVTFSLPGFNTVRREGVELTGSMTATVNADLSVGSLEETITVTGASPLVDVQSSRRQETLSSEVINTIPSARGYAALAVLVPGITGSADVGGLGANSVRGGFGAHGANDGRLYVDGNSVGSAASGTTSSYSPDTASSAELVVTASAGNAEAEAGGPMVNVVPRSGSNTVSGVMSADGASAGMQGSNYTQALKDRGLRAPNELIKMWDVSGGLGGPLRQDRLWYFLSARHTGNREYIAGMFYNQNAGDPTKWTYEPDLTRRAFRDYTFKDVGLRLTWQATGIHRFGFYWDEQSECNSCLSGGNAVTSPDAFTAYSAWPNRLYQATWTAPVTNRVLLEAGFSMYDAQHHGTWERTVDNNRDLIRVTEQAGLIPGLTYRSQNWQSHKGASPRWRSSMSYITGSHTLKVGYQGAHFWRSLPEFTNNHRLSYRLNNGVPNQLTMWVRPYDLKPHIRWTALYAQDQWTLGRTTLQAGLRYDYANSFFDEQGVGPERFLPERIVFPKQAGAKGFHDLNPRLGLTHDLWGNGRTALKASVGRYVVAAGTNVRRYSDTNPMLRLALSTTRSWNDQNRDFAPDCDLLNPAANGECGAWGNQGFGRVSQSTTHDPAILEGWGVRPADWFLQAGVQQQLVERVSAQVEYIHRWFLNPDVTDNLLVGPADYDPFSIVAPADPRLPGGGGYTISGLYDISPAKFGATQNFVTAASEYGSWKEYWHGVDMSITARLREGLTAQGGFSTGRRVTDRCDVLPRIDDPSPLYCRVEEQFQTQIKGLAAYTIPKVDVQISGTFQSRPGVELLANWNVPTAVVAPSLGRNLAGGERTVAVNLVEPGTLYGDRITQIDFRVSKVIRFGGTRLRAGVDLYNAFNANPVQSYNLTYGPRWLTPTSILAARFAKVSAQFDF